MKKVLAAAALVTLLFVATSCESLAKGALDTLVAGAASGGKSAVASSASKTVDFQADDVLATDDTGKADECAYYVARIVTPASAATKNQAEAIWVYDGKKQWVNRVTPTRKADKSDFKVGALVFYSSYLSGAESTTQDDYRKTTWYLGRVTSVDELYKDRVEVAGHSCTIAFLRVPTIDVGK